MPHALDKTHDPALRSWVTDANGHTDFPIQNLPFGIARAQGLAAGGCVAIGDHILPLARVTSLLTSDARQACEAAAAPTLNSFLAMGPAPRAALRKALSALLAAAAPPRPDLLIPASACELLLPAHIGDYTDFYAGIVHAENVGRLFRPDNPLLPNYKWIPIGYHGRSSSVCVSGEDVRRPGGQLAAHTFAPTAKLDFELELALWIGPGNTLGEPIPIAAAANSIAGYGLLNDWSARDLQSWEYQPLGPFLGKSFHTTVSPWIVTPEALAPFRRAQPPRANEDPQPLAYLFDEQDKQHGALTLALEAWLTTPSLAEPFRLTQTEAAALYWTPAQLVAHHASNGCNLRPGDLLGTGTISSDANEGAGSLLERTHNGTVPLHLPNGETRTFLEDGDTITLRAHAHREGFISIGFGECAARVVAAK